MSETNGKNGKLMWQVLFWVVTVLMLGGLTSEGNAIIRNDEKRAVEDSIIKKEVSDLKDCISNKLEALMKSDGEIKERLAKIETKVDYYGKR
jgi:hypothetical protein